MLYFFPACLVKEGYGTRQNARLSKVDITWMQKMYPNKNKNVDYYKKYYEGGSSIIPSGINKWVYIVLGFLVLILIIFLVSSYFKHKNNKSGHEGNREFQPAYNERYRQQPVYNERYSHQQQQPVYNERYRQPIYNNRGFGARYKRK